MDDGERLIIKNNIRRLVYKHRYFASAEWAMGEDLIGEMLDILDSINFTQQEYDFEYLFRPRMMVLFWIQFLMMWMTKEI